MKILSRFIFVSAVSVALPLIAKANGPMLATEILNNIVAALVEVAPVECGAATLTSYPASSPDFRVEVRYTYECKRTDLTHDFKVVFNQGSGPGVRGILADKFDIGPNPSVNIFTAFVTKAVPHGLAYVKKFEDPYATWDGTIGNATSQGFRFPGTNIMTEYDITSTSHIMFLETSIEGSTIYFFLGGIG